MLSHANLHFSGGAVQKASHVAGVNRSLMTLPLSHAYGLLLTVSAMHSPERPVTVLLRWFDPAAFLELIAEHRLQTSAVVPSMIHVLLGEPLERHDLSSLVYLGCGAAPLPPKAAEEIERRIPSVTVRQGYGLTETAALIATNPAGREKPGSVGLPIPGVTVRILDDDDRELPAGEAGEICCRSPAVMRGYWRAGGRDQADRRGRARRLAPHRRHRLPRRGGLPVHRRPQEGPDHPRRLQRVPARRRGRAARAPGGGRRRRGRAPGRAPRRGGRRVRVAADAGRAERGRVDRVGAAADRRLQVPARGPHPRRDPAHRRSGSSTARRSAAVCYRPSSMADLAKRSLGVLGPEVSVIGLGCNNFGRRVDARRDPGGGRRRLRRGHHVPRHRGHLRRSPRSQRGVPRRGPPGPPRPGRARDEVRDEHGRRSRSPWLARLHPARRSRRRCGAFEPT